MSDIPDPRGEIFVEERPWGAFAQLTANTPATVKVITVEPGHRLSLQTHAHRAELWRVLDGTMDVTVGERTWRAEAGEDVWVPLGAIHRMGNTGQVPARVLEIGFGHFDEADIVRLEDDYTR